MASNESTKFRKPRVKALNEPAEGRYLVRAIFILEAAVGFEKFKHIIKQTHAIRESLKMQQSRRDIFPSIFLVNYQDL